MAAERALEGACASVIARRVRWLSKQRPQDVDPREIAILLRTLEQRYPQDLGRGPHRQIDSEMDPATWWEKHGLEAEQLRALLRDPPESIEAALLAEGDTIVARLLAGGWHPSTALRGVVGAACRPDEDPKEDRGA